MAAAPPLLLSVVIPALDEREAIGDTLDALGELDARECEVLVADGGSHDGTAAVVAARGHRVVRCARGRALQMNGGAKLASGRLLTFLHADTVPSQAALRRLLEVARGQRAVWGRFRVRLSGAGLAFRIIEAMMNARSCVSGIATGDQMIFVSRELFESLGGFPEIPLMEDIALSKRLRSRSRPLCCRERVTASSRRWQRDGVVRTVLLMWRLRLAYFLGADPARLAARYDRG